jgi:glutaconate CoA-transferase subunit A
VQLDTVRMMDNEMDIYIAKSAKVNIVSVEEIVDEAEIIRTPTQTMLPKLFVDHVVHLPFGAHPNSCDTRYDFDLEHGELYQERAKTPEGFARYLDEYVYGTADETEYLAKVGGLDALRARLGR